MPKGAEGNHSMLQDLKSQLKTLAADPQDAFATKIRQRVGAYEAAHYAKPLRSLILVMPELIAQIRSWMEAPGVPAPLKRLHGFLLSYLYHPTDFLPESDGLFGYLDDAYLVGRVYARTMEQLDHRTRRALPNLDDLSTQVAPWLALTRRLLPAETQRIDHLLEEIVAGRPQAFQHMLDNTEEGSRGRVQP
jgi:uncharacterized membrane protein YkvA (DUF1232 family)